MTGGEESETLKIKDEGWAWSQKWDLMGVMGHKSGLDTTHAHPG